MTHAGAGGTGKAYENTPDEKRRATKAVLRIAARKDCPIDELQPEVLGALGLDLGEAIDHERNHPDEQ